MYCGGTIGAGTSVEFLDARNDQRSVQIPFLGLQDSIWWARPGFLDVLLKSSPAEQGTVPGSHSSKGKKAESE